MWKKKLMSAWWPIITLTGTCQSSSVVVMTSTNSFYWNSWRPRSVWSWACVMFLNQCTPQFVPHFYKQTNKRSPWLHTNWSRVRQWLFSLYSCSMMMMMHHLQDCVKNWGSFIKIMQLKNRCLSIQHKVFRCSAGLLWFQSVSASLSLHVVPNRLHDVQFRALSGPGHLLQAHPCSSCLCR